MTDIRGHESNSENRHQERRITVAGARRMLGMIGKNYDDEEIAEVLDVLYGIAEESYEIFIDHDLPPNKGAQA
jgi:hypothetical protein